MKAVSIREFAFLACVGVVVLFESFRGLVQPKPASVIVITTADADGNAQDRVVTPIRDGGQLLSPPITGRAPGTTAR